MASIFRRSDATYWFAAYRAADGRRVKITTKTEDEDEAQRIADRLELEAREAKDKRKASASLSGVNDALQRATQLVVAGKLDAIAARDLVNDLLIAAGQEKLDVVTNRAWCDDWRKSKAGAVTERSRMKYEQVARNWLDFLNGKADKPLEAVNKADAIAHRDHLASDGLSPRTVNQTVKLLRGIYNEALEQGHIGRNPFAGVDRLREDAESAHRVPFTAEEVSALVGTAEGDWKGIILVAASTGLRLMDAARLKWKNLKLEATPPQLHIKTSKTGAVLDIPLHNAFVSWIEAQPRGIGDAPVFPSLANKSGPGKSGLSMAFMRLMKRAGICAQVARNGDGRGRTTSQKSFHSLRHFAATQMAQNGVRPEIARAITGHADPETHSNYITADTASLQSAVAGIKIA